MRRIGVKKHLRGLVDAPARNDDTANGWMQSRFSAQPDFRFSQIMLFFTTAAHFTWLLHVHLHIITSDLLTDAFSTLTVANIIADYCPSSFPVRKFFAKCIFQMVKADKKLHGLLSPKNCQLFIIPFKGVA